jgi:Protein of unknown function (DUF2523)
MKIGTWVLSLVQPMLAKIFLTVGFSVVSIVGMDSVLLGIKNSFVASMQTMPSEWLNLALYLWLGKGLGIIFGACSTKLMLWTIQNSTQVLGRSNG